MINRNPSDEELEFLRRAPMKNERPAHIKAMHEEAAQQPLHHVVGEPVEVPQHGLAQQGSLQLHRPRNTCRGLRSLHTIHERKIERVDRRRNARISHRKKGTLLLNYSVRKCKKRS